MLDLPAEAPDLVLYRGDDRVQEYVLRTPDGEPVETVGWDFVCQVRLTGKPLRVNVPASSDVEGRILLDFPAALFDLLASGKFDVEGQRDGKTLTFVRGKLTVTDDVTRREP